MADVVIRPMTIEDIGVVAQLERKIFPEPWSEQAFLDELRQDNRRYFVTLAGDEIVGYGGLFLVDEDAHIANLGVIDGWRGGGIGTRLLLRLIEAALEARAENVTLEVRVGNDAARHLYQRFGFVPAGIRKNYYRNEDALVMWALDVNGAPYARRLAKIRGSLDG